MPCSGCLDLLKKDLRRMGEAQQNYHAIKLLPVTMRVSTWAGVREIRELEVFILLFQGSVMVVHMLISFSWYPPAKQVPLFLGANSQQS